MELTVKGIPELRRELERLDLRVQRQLARNAVMAAARLAASFMRQIVPVDEGDLKRSIKARFPKGRGRMGRVGQAVAYANAAAGHAGLVEYGHGHQAAQSYLRRTIDEQQAAIVERRNSNLATGIQRELRKQAVAAEPDETGVI
jgi:HK97 gp10 family phage protein